ncbi:helix-turn-helix domain-containing protein [Ktedonospora formicarum]|uniref:HTH cro/C1-type domain-containing protein n=1 Tax=Ktedonospora formicarum TaxID=2778364 RepID=A0A8J3I5U5_9CHLR|nr:helix-turn-helix transcriptional regulator [Ktedonospora formicarum]GHO49191.1 hypothetical protein KSX_73540 [Ktedonospora formicarum]
MQISFATRLRQARLNQQLTQEDVAEYLDIATITVARWEQGKAIPNIFSVQRLCQLYHLSPNDLLAIEENNETEAPYEALGQVYQITITLQLSAPSATEQYETPPFSCSGEQLFQALLLLHHLPPSENFIQLQTHERRKLIG